MEIHTTPYTVAWVCGSYVICSEMLKEILKEISVHEGNKTQAMCSAA
jgi:hypothetical protein